MTEDRVQRRLAAILVADVVGYARLMGADEAGTLAALRAVWAELFDPLVAGHRGRIAKKMGDGALVAFQGAVDAVDCRYRRASERGPAGMTAAIERSTKPMRRQPCCSW